MMESVAPDPRRWWALALLCGAFLMVILDAAIVTLALIPVLLPESRAATVRRSYDPAGALTITGALVLLVYAVVEAPDTGWTSAQTIGLFAGSAALLGTFGL